MTRRNGTLKSERQSRPACLTGPLDVLAINVEEYISAAKA
jgi:hypothetical protein